MLFHIPNGLEACLITNTTTGGLEDDWSGPVLF